MSSIRARIARVAAPIVGAAAIVTTVAAAPASASPGAPYIHEGSTGFAVTCLQTALNHWNRGLAVDGIDGPQTTAAVKWLQSAFFLTQDGIVGPATGHYVWGALQELNRYDCQPYIPTPDV